MRTWRNFSISHELKITLSWRGNVLRPLDALANYKSVTFAAMNIIKFGNWNQHCLAIQGICPNPMRISLLLRQLIRFWRIAAYLPTNYANYLYDYLANFALCSLLALEYLLFRKSTQNFGTIFHGSCRAML